MAWVSAQAGSLWELLQSCATTRVQVASRVDVQRLAASRLQPHDETRGGRRRAVHLRLVRQSTDVPNLPDVNTGLEALAASQAAKTFLGPLAERVLGPTADYLGEGLQGWTERRRRNVERIIGKADALLVDEQRARGSVPPKVLKARVSGY